MANLVELFDNIVQMQALNGVPLANGKLYVYALGRTRLMDTWSDVDGESLNTNPIILDDAGQAHCFVSDDFDYTLVVCDAYNNEVFSIDKYLYSKGEHSHADVAVAPSEHIGVSSYHVGETTVYVPYITGELGKTYHGIEPIVVNNQENKISARNIPLGVQEPLYFVEDSESACIIGCSGDTTSYTNTDRTVKIEDHKISTDMQAVMIRQQINNSSTDYKYAKICEADLNTVTWINEWMTTLQLNFQSCGAYYKGKSFGTFVLNCENYVQSSSSYVQKHEEDGKWVLFDKDDNSPQIVKLYLYWRDDSSSQHYELWGEFANLKYYESVGVAAILNCSLRNHLTSSLPIDQERNIWRFNPIGIESLKNSLPTDVGDLVKTFDPADADIKPIAEPDPGTFYATYVYNGPASGNTSFEDIKAAYDAGKSVYVNYKENTDSKDTLVYSLVLFRDTPVGRPDLSCFFFTNLDRGTESCIYRFPSNWGKMSDRNLADADSLWTLEQSIAPDDYLVPIPSPSGVYCTRNYKVYKALEPITSNTWVDSAWTQVNVMDEIYNLQNKEENHDLFIAEYPTTDASAVQSALSAGKYVVTKLGTNFIPITHSYETGATFCGLVGGNSGGAGGYTIDVDFSTGWSEPVSISFATYPGVQGMISAGLTGKLDNSASANFYPMEGNPSGFLTTHQDLSEYAKTEDLTAYQEKGDYYSASNPSGFINSDAISAMATTGFVADVSADITAMIPTALTGDYLTKDSADTLYYGIDNPSGFITGVDLTPYQMTAEMTAYQPVGDYLTTGDSANFYTTANESGFITGVDLTPYQTVEGMTAYQEAGEYYSASNPSGFLTGVDLTPYQTTAEMTGYLTTGDSAEFMTTAERADFYTTANESGFITGVPSESSGLWQTASETVTANSGVWGGSALPISAGLGIKFEMVDGTLVASTSGYVWQSALLFHTDTPVTQTTYTLSDSCSNYDKLEVDFYDINNWRTQMDCPIPSDLESSGTRGGYFSVVPASTATGAAIWFKAFNWTAANTTWECYCSEIAATGGSTTQTVNANQPSNPPKVVNIIGWKRVGGN